MNPKMADIVDDLVRRLRGALPNVPESMLQRLELDVRHAWGGVTQSYIAKKPRKRGQQDRPTLAPHRTRD